MTQPLRLTLRTLLSYLDDTLEPAQARVIGQKVQESEQAQELMNRIKEVTRKRRLTTPPPGPGGIDPNTIADYLDNEVTPEQSMEVEQICLASEVHLAEVAACHQILTLVLGEPAMVPPSAKQRMYALVKGPESIPYRKPPKGMSKPDLDLSTEIAGDPDETLRLGMPSMGKKSSLRNRLLLAVAGVAAACLLFVALWQLLNNNDTIRDPNNGDKRAEVDLNKDKKDSGSGDEKKDSGSGEVKTDPGETKKDPGEDKKTDVKPIGPPPAPMMPEVAFGPPSNKVAVVGRLAAGSPKEPSILLQSPTDKIDWKRLPGREADVSSGRLLMSIPGVKNTIQFAKGPQMILWGNLPEVTGQSHILESIAEIHVDDKLDLDLTLRRGRIVVATPKGAKSALVRVRVEDPTQGKMDHLDVLLEGPDAAVAFDRWTSFDPKEPFYPDRKEVARKGPKSIVVCVALTGSSVLRVGDLTFALLPADFVSKDSWDGVSNPVKLPAQLLEWYSGMPALPAGADPRPRNGALKACENLVRNLDSNKAIDIALAEMLRSQDPSARQLAVRGLSALDDVASIIDEFNSESNAPDVRRTCIEVLKHWIAQDRDNDYKLHDLLRDKSIKSNVAARIMELLHWLPPDRLSQPKTFETLIEDLDNSALMLRELSAWHLAALVPAGRSIAYSAVAPQPARAAAVRAWQQLVPAGKMPPAGKKR